MYSLIINCLEDCSDENSARVRFNYLRKNIISGHSTIESIKLIDKETGEILNEYKRL